MKCRSRCQTGCRQNMPHRMAERMSDWMPDRLPERIRMTNSPKGMSEQILLPESRKRASSAWTRMALMHGERPSPASSRSRMSDRMSECRNICQKKGQMQCQNHLPYSTPGDTSETVLYQHSFFRAGISRIKVFFLVCHFEFPLIKLLKTYSTETGFEPPAVVFAALLLDAWLTRTKTFSLICSGWTGSTGLPNAKINH